MVTGGSKFCLQGIAAQELRQTTQTLTDDLYWLQQQSMNHDTATIYTMYFFYTYQHGYLIRCNEVTIKRVAFPASVIFQGQPTWIAFLPSGAPVHGAQTILLYSPVLQRSQSVILMPVTGRIRLSP